ncbi:MAG: septum formation protein [Parcubacteria group bacterium Gr01-1014_48]|nr:MAG: septum formation protein [Parcubacteria group bacterium Greene0416_14]TSC73808.1 MAG: septum formation protein [Parcubacteria group bacterium Gr01-1014_48]TSD01074.1 MAG: septum formation protein [Parcubacteria group bacterium Greene1014_15]TSD08063.1 MAG: septum formation protein [Parcubacteria group bacterium Greene0714_4]
MKQIILASTSPRRKELLAEEGVVFECIAADYEEDMTLPLPPPELARHLALGKAQSVAKNKENALVIGADTLISLDGSVFGKPKTKERAREMIRAMNGKSHSIITGYAVIDSDTGKTITKTIETKVFFRKLSEKDIEKYLDVSDALDRAGAYAIQDHGGKMLIDRFEGDYANALGLPVNAVIETLKQFEDSGL